MFTYKDIIAPRVIIDYLRKNNIIPEEITIDSDNQTSYSETDGSTVQFTRLFYKGDSDKVYEIYDKLFQINWEPFLEANFHTKHLDYIRDITLLRWFPKNPKPEDWVINYTLQEIPDPDDEVRAYASILITDQSITFVLTDPAF
jgi:hypothetical protein